MVKLWIIVWIKESAYVKKSINSNFDLSALVALFNNLDFKRVK